MKQKNFFLIALSIFCIGSCIKPELPNAECDITEAIFSVRKENSDKYFYNPSDSLVKVRYSDNEIIFNVKRNANLSKVALKFKTTEGATISPESGSFQDFSKGSVIYTVKSEDGNWKREYIVKILSAPILVNEEVRFDFENYDDAGKFFIWKEPQMGEIPFWDSGNAGFAMTDLISSTPKEKYPTVSAEGYEGKCVRMITRSTGFFAGLAKKPIAAGNLFIGRFDKDKASSSPLLALDLGIPFDKKPVKLSGFYTYKPGSKYIDKNKKVHQRQDEADIYAVFFENHDENGRKVELNGENTFTSPHIVAVARVKALPETDKWTEFEAVFEYKKDIDLDYLESNKYSLTIVMTSSKNGGIFEGAEGSTLNVDSMVLNCKLEK